MKPASLVATTVAVHRPPVGTTASGPAVFTIPKSGDFTIAATRRRIGAASVRDASMTATQFPGGGVGSYISIWPEPAAGSDVLTNPPLDRLPPALYSHLP